ENLSPGAVSKIEAKDAAGTWHNIWEGKDTTAAPAGWLEAKIDAAKATATKVIKITLDSARVAGWNEIDAVELIGEPELDVAPKAGTNKK
ncbi:MAG TPA: hypothetical protein VEJ63_17855, partial [Planctomycetota bacterium]|nr:hypothetical protein [Planctomycetota bacterium]